MNNFKPGDKAIYEATVEIIEYDNFLHDQFLVQLESGYRFTIDSSKLKKIFTREWSVDYYVYILPYCGEIELLTKDQLKKEGLTPDGCNWIERRHYKQIDNKITLISSEKI